MPKTYGSCFFQDFRTVMERFPRSKGRKTRISGCFGLSGLLSIKPDSIRKSGGAYMTDCRLELREKGRIDWFRVKRCLLVCLVFLGWKNLEVCSTCGVRIVLAWKIVEVPLGMKKGWNILSESFLLLVFAYTVYN